MKSFSQFQPASQMLMTNKNSGNAGFSLVEVLISIIILSFGLLGLVGLQAAALQANRDARLQSVANAFARELGEMMRGNKDVANRTSTDVLTNPYLGQFSNPNGTTPLGPLTKYYCLNVGSTCSTVTQTAQSQMTDWLTRIDAELPGVRVEICPDNAPFDAQGVPQWSNCPPAPVNETILVKIGWTRNSTNRTSEGAAALVKATNPSIVIPISAGNT